MASHADVTAPQDVTCLVFMPKSVSCSHRDKTLDGLRVGTVSYTSDQGRWGTHGPAQARGPSRPPQPERHGRCPTPSAAARSASASQGPAPPPSHACVLPRPRDRVGLTAPLASVFHGAEGDRVTLLVS